MPADITKQEDQFTLFLQLINWQYVIQHANRNDSSRIEDERWLLAAYSEWCLDNNYVAMTETEFWSLVHRYYPY